MGTGQTNRQITASFNAPSGGGKIMCKCNDQKWDSLTVKHDKMKQKQVQSRFYEYTKSVKNTKVTEQQTRTQSS